ncbi:hypothetical protein [Paenibacillus macerans]|uniref:hypothetical protein n=1 Tax=Paenibacillus macerans TaxID=44252 RepID=UPI00203C9DFA|nr:hypothetical protein [Paenibacillus macerans]MCM3698468.1 hypothetical protein [Paenibacillus macerans]
MEKVFPGFQGGFMDRSGSCGKAIAPLGVLASYTSFLGPLLNGIVAKCTITYPEIAIALE